MLEESIRTIQEAEQRAEQDKAACRARIQRMLADAEAQAADLAVQAEDTLRREQASLLAKAEAEAAADREIILQQAAGQCDALRAKALQNSNRAIGAILAGEV